MAAETIEEIKDPIVPSVVDHRHEAAVHKGTRELLFRYNYLYYRFDVSDGEIWARSYLEEIDHASLFLPKGMTLSHPDAKRVLTFLACRFPRVQMLGESGYVTVWPKDGETDQSSGLKSQN
jgi:hypothetical protein